MIQIRIGNADLDPGQGNWTKFKNKPNFQRLLYLKVCLFYDKLPTLSIFQAVLRIRDPVPFWPLDPGWVESQHPDPGRTTRWGIDSKFTLNETFYLRGREEVPCRQPQGTREQNGPTWINNQNKTETEALLSGTNRTRLRMTGRKHYYPEQTELDRMTGRKHYYPEQTELDCEWQEGSITIRNKKN